MTDEKRTELKRALNHVSDLLSRGLASRRAFRTYDGDREIDKTLGYRGDISFSDYLGRYRRMGVAGEIVDKPAKTTWRSDPEIREADSDDDTDFTEAVEELARRTRLWARAEQVDRLAGIGNYAVMLIGSTKGEDLSRPLTEDSIEGPEDIGYFSVFRQDHARIEDVEADTTNPRLGRPTLYDLTLFAERTSAPQGVDRSREAHWSRIVHVAEDPLEDDIFGRPRQERVFNDEDDLLKYKGSSAEIFWLQVAGILVAKHSEDVEVDESAMEDFEDDVMDVLHKITRFLQVQGTELEWLTPDQAPDPSGLWEVTKAMLSVGTGIPQRILFGSERGELASTQDEANWFGKIEERRGQHAEPVIIRPTLDRLIDVGALPEPSSGDYRVEWEPLFQLSELQMAEVQKNRAETVKTLAEAFLAGGETAMEMAAALVPELEEILEDGLRATNAFRDEEDRLAAEEVERLLREVAESGGGNGRRRRTTRPGR